MKCIHCKNTVDDDDIFCAKCGEKIIRENIHPNCEKDSNTSQSSNSFFN